MTKTVSSNQKYSIDAFFSGVGGIELGFEQTGEFSVVYANEFDKNARETYELNHPTTPLDGRDIHDVQPDELPDADVMMGGFPCQAFSIAGYRKGFEDERGDLFFELLKLIQVKRPRVVFIENVKNLVTHDKGNTFKVIREALVENGYYIKWKVLNSKDYGNVPQNRERIYVVGFKSFDDFNDFKFPDEIQLTNTIHDVIDFDGKKDESLYYKEGKQPFYSTLERDVNSTDTVYQWRRQYVRENKSGLVPTLTANMGTGGHNVPIIFTNSGEIRKLTPKETFNAQGYPKDFKLPEIANSQLYKQAGNSVVVPVIRRIAENIAGALNSNEYIDNDIKQGKYALIYSNLNSRFEGESFVRMYADSKEKLKDTIENDSVPLISDEDYLKLVQKKKQAEFYMIEKV
ncbi:DNA (cytosine-5)-methyltransferase 1 [Weissella uvarum]|uniref:DNA cytosine methyltransferase n=1 Tax=Weissella uvarum TaxID=1479233 RepID=UPI0019605451|nr:DNA cytosine methyltransferase [Weissella uvarum]MBM7616726.1 DNA (cytosine-5)-methyltransferase 1 [Weissella uvarum]MCM0594821.1 DNA cytosine methyltransferase [Weissella uvarum]